MQTFSSVSRNSIIKNLLINFVFLVFYIFYVALSSVYIVLPPLLGILFAKYIRDVKHKRLSGVFCIFVCCVFFEVERSSIVGVLFLLFIFLSFLVNKTLTLFREKGYLFGLIYVFLPYIFYFLFLQTFMVFSGQPPIEVDFYLLWYLFVEGVIVLWRR
ncbi:hypothetical protein [Helicobacter anatolicus]|uniref:hypothetical protein n=1 Tax=Helicobacter anatolicus TaxID=2905874 RepID=UPI001E341801|nr:hypothetical protein [Helicobacter anatolicus]MCE3040136.1 hypothetical protein [Helicobacter anatolicus]